MRTFDNTGRITVDTIGYNLAQLSQIVFEVTDACNLACEYCAFGDLYFGYDRRESQYMKYEDAKAVIDYRVDFWCRFPTEAEVPYTTISFYGGEPLLNFPLIEQIVSYVESLKVSRHFCFSMISNCMLLDRYMDYLSEKQFALLCSLDGDAFADGYRVDHQGNPSFKRVFANIKALQSKYPSYFSSNVNFNSVLHNRNSVEGVFDFIQNEFGKSPAFAELSNVGVRPEMQDAYNAAFRNMSESLHQSHKYSEISEKLAAGDPDRNEAFIYLDSWSGNVFSSYMELLRDESPRFTPSATCSPFSKKMFIKVDGKIMQCERIPHMFSLGTVKNAAVHLDLEEVANNFNGYLDSIQNRCSICAQKQDCPQCLFTLDWDGKETPGCKYFLRTKTQNIQRDQCMSFLYSHPESYRQFLEETLYD